MKPKHIKKETANRLRMGFHTDLMNVFEEAVDLYTEDSFNRGYDSFFDDARIHAERLAERIMTLSAMRSAKAPFNVIAATEVIEEYFNSLKTE